jgi:uncharacterized protein YuzE
MMMKMVLYLHFKKPNHADRSEMTDDNIIIWYENYEIIGLLVLNASKRNDLK